MDFERSVWISHARTTGSPFLSSEGRNTRRNTVAWSSFWVERIGHRRMNTGLVTRFAFFPGSILNQQHLPMSAAALLAAAEAGHVTALVAAAASDPPGDAMLALDDSELTRFWAATDQIVESALDVAEPAMKPDEPSDDEAVGQALDTLYAITILAHASIADPERAAPEELTEVACRLHDIIFDLTDPRASQLQSAIVALCEAWWLSEREGRVDLVPQTVSYMLVRALHEKATTADIKRLYTFRQALTSLDHADETVLPLQRLLLHCAIRPNILRCAEGRKLVAYFFSLHVPFIAELHRSIKSQIPVCRKSQREAYGEVYFRAWRNAAPGSDALAEIEERCVQDLMWHGLHASSTSVASAVRQVLAFTNNQKRQRGVDAMLHKLWAPLLWRNMQVANPHMRRNAATLFVEAFPLYDPAMSTVDIDGALQRQFDALSKLLMDESVGVRVVAVHGTCRVLALFWELIPSSTSRAFLTTLVKDLAHDASANTVRIAVLQGLKFLLTQNGSEELVAALKTCLAPLSTLVNDGSERVRAALFELLLAVAKVRTLNWQSVVKPEALLARLPIEKPDMQMRLTRLLLPLYLPGGKPLQQVAAAGRLVELVGSGSPAALALLVHTPRFATSSACLRLVGILLGDLLSDASPEELLEHAASPSALPPRAAPLPHAELTARLEALATFIEALAPTLDVRGERAPAPAKKKGGPSKPADDDEEEDDEAEAAADDDGGLGALLDDVSMERLSEAAKASMGGQRALTRLAAWLPASAVPHLASECLRDLALVPAASATTTRLAPLLACACAWEQDGALVAKIAESLGAPAATAASAAAAGKKRGRKSKGGDGDGRLAAPLALKALWAALTTASTRECLLSNQSTALKNLLPLLEGRANGLAAATAGGAAASDGALATVDEAQRAMSCYVQLSWHLASKAAATAAAAEANADTAGAGRAPKGGKRLTKADKAAAEASAASEAALSAREAGSLALDRVMAWTAADAPAPRTDSATSATLGEIAFIEPSPGQARQRTRPRTVLDENNPGNQPMSAFDESPMKAPPANAAGESALAAQILGCAWLAEGGMLGLMNAAQASRAVDYVRTTLRAAAAASPASASDAERSASPFAQVLPHVSKMVVLLFEGLPAHTPDAKPNEAAAAELHFLATDLLFGLLEAGTSSADAAPAARALLLESMALVAVERPFSLDILVRRLLAHVTAAIGTSLAAAQSAGARTEPTDAEGCGVGGLDLPPLSAAVAEALTLRTAGCAPALLPSLSAACVGAFERADAPALTACVTFLLACDGMRRPELPGRLELRRALEGLGDASKAAAALEAGADLNVVAPSGAMRARMDALPAEARASFGQLAPPLLRASALLAAE